MNIASAGALAPTDMCGASGLPAAIPHHVIGLERRYERVLIVPIIKAEVLLTEARVDTTLEVNESPAFGMG
jgi:hypothetical protein